MSVELDPVELGFQRPFTREVSQVLRLKNPHSEPVAFKVKTTAPKQYCVRPNSGRIESGHVVDVQVLLQAMKEDPPLEAKCRDKFLVQSVAISSEAEFQNVAQAWTQIEQTNKSAIHEKKIRVTFLPASGGSVGGMASTPLRQSMGHDEVPPAYSSPMSNAATPQQSSSAAPVGAVSRMESRPTDAKSSLESASSTRNPATSSGVAATASGAAAAVVNAIPSNQEELKAQLAQAQAKIAELTRQAQEQTGLRQRKVESSASDSKKPSTVATQQAPGGVAVPIVAILCLISFLLAYLLF